MYGNKGNEKDKQKKPVASLENQNQNQNQNSDVVISLIDLEESNPQSDQEIQETLSLPTISHTFQLFSPRKETKSLHSNGPNNKLEREMKQNNLDVNQGEKENKKEQEKMDSMEREKVKVKEKEKKKEKPQNEIRNENENNMEESIDERPSI